MSTDIKAFIFDLDDTLVVEEASAEAAFLETCELARIRYGIEPAALHRTVRRTCRELWYGFPSHPYCKRIGISSWEGMWAEFTGAAPELKPLCDWARLYRMESWKLALHAHGIEDPEMAAEMGELFPQLRRKKNVLYPDAIPTLKQMSGCYSLGLLTNGAPDLQRRKIEGAGIAGFFNHVLLAGEMGVGKPDPLVFRALLSHLKAAADTTIVIGDRLATDIKGAHNAGMRAVWLNRACENNGTDISPDWEISSLHELSPIFGLQPSICN